MRFRGIEGAEGDVLNIGRKTRPIPPAIRSHQFHLARWKNHPTRPQYTFQRERRGSDHQKQGNGSEHHLKHLHPQVVRRENGQPIGRFGITAKGVMVYFMLCQEFLPDRELELYCKML